MLVSKKLVKINEIRGEHLFIK